MSDSTKDDPIHDKLDILTHSMMESRAENTLHRGAVIRTQWIACAVVVLVVLVTAIAW